MTQTSKEDVATLLENFKDYVNPKRKHDPWFTLDEINRQFAWEDIPDNVLSVWLDELADEGLVESRIEDGRWEYRWQS